MILPSVLLDLDGTLIDSRPGIAASCAAALQALGHEPDPALDITPLIGPPLPQVITRLLAHYGDDRVDAGMTAYRAHYGTIGLHMATFYSGIPEAVDRLAQRARCFVVTSKRKDFAARIVASLEFSGAIAAVYGTEPDGSVDDKARLIAAVLRTEGLEPGETVMVGDRSHDVIGAHANALRAIGVLWGYGSRAELESAGADALAVMPGDLAVLASPSADHWHGG
jgi:phosphoglycolate phosphatase